MTETRAGGGFNEVFFADVRVAAENLIGEQHHGWAMTKETLADERVFAVPAWGHMGPRPRPRGTWST